MTSILLSLNSSKTEFLLIGLKRQLSKIHNSSTSIDTTQSARNLGFISDEHLSFSDQISAKYCVSHIRRYLMLSFPPLHSYQSELKHELTTPVMLLAQLLALVKAMLYTIINAGDKLHQSYKKCESYNY